MGYDILAMFLYNMYMYYRDLLVHVHVHVHAYDSTACNVLINGHSLLSGVVYTVLL